MVILLSHCNRIADRVVADDNDADGDCCPVRRVRINPYCVACNKRFELSHLSVPVMVIPFSGQLMFM